MPSIPALRPPLSPLLPLTPPAKTGRQFLPTPFFPRRHFCLAMSKAQGVLSTPRTALTAHSRPSPPSTILPSYNLLFISLYIPPPTWGTFLKAFSLNRLHHRTSNSLAPPLIPLAALIFCATLYYRLAVNHNLASKGRQPHLLPLVATQAPDQPPCASQSRRFLLPNFSHVYSRQLSPPAIRRCATFPPLVFQPHTLKGTLTTLNSNLYVM